MHSIYVHIRIVSRPDERLALELLHLLILDIHAGIEGRHGEGILYRRVMVISKGFYYPSFFGTILLFPDNLIILGLLL